MKFNKTIFRNKSVLLAATSTVSSAKAFRHWPGVGVKTNASVDLKKMIDDWTKEHYHKPSDQYREDFFNWDAAVTYVKLNFLVGYLVANASQRPKWNKGDFLERPLGRGGCNDLL